jgi:hypothetical protein
MTGAVHGAPPTPLPASGAFPVAIDRHRVEPTPTGRRLAVI